MLEEDTLIQKTLEAWQPLFTQPLTHANASEILLRWQGFLRMASQAIPSVIERPQDAQKNKGLDP